MTNQHALYALARNQHAVFSRRQAIESGFSRNAIEHRRRKGEWTFLSPQVITLTGSDPSDTRQLMAAILDAGDDAAISHQTAAAFYGLPGYELRPTHLVRPRLGSRHPSDLATIHTSTYLPKDHLAVIDHIAITTPSRVAFDLSGHVHPAKFERTVETMWSRRLTSWARLKGLWDEVPRQGRPRMTEIRAYLDARGPDYVPADSGVELRLRDILKQDGQDPLDQQPWIGNEDECLGRIDFIDRLLRLIVFVDSDLFHGSLIDQQRDAAQTAALEALGYQVLRIRAFDIWHNANRVCTQIRTARRAARARIAQEA